MFRCCRWRRCCCSCLHFRIHPLEHNVDVRGASNQEELPPHQGSFDSITEQETRVSLESSLYGREQAEITAIHAAAVNGNKSSLSKLLAAGWHNLDAGDKSARTPLMYCVLGDRMECAELLLKAGADVNKKDVIGRSALHWAALKGNVLCVKTLLGKGADWTDKDEEGQTAVHLATRHKSARCLMLLLKQLQPGAVDDQDNSKRTALHLAAMHGNVDPLKLLIRQDSNISIPDIEGRTPLHWAASSANPQAVDCAQLILETAPSVINWQDYEGCTALHLAVACGNEAVVSALVAVDKCNITALDNVFRTPLHWAMVLGHTSIARLLLDNKADYCSSDSNGATPLHYAAQNNHASTVEMFLSYPGVRDEVDNEGRTAFLWAACRGANDVIGVFVRHSVDLTLSDKTGATALHMAALGGDADTVSLLLRCGAPIDSLDHAHHTALLRACEAGHAPVVLRLIEGTASVKTADLDGRTPLHWAALGGHAYICQMIIKRGVEPNIRDLAGRTPLQCAAYGGYVNCMSVLIEHGACPNLCDREGMTSLHWACSKGCLDAVKLLIQHNAGPNKMEFTEDRYTALDYGLMGEHFDVCQYMIEQGAVSITGIRDIAALKIQAWFRGYEVRKTFLERKKLLMKHEQLRKDQASKKKAMEESRRRENLKNREQDSASPPAMSSLPDLMKQDQEQDQEVCQMEEIQEEVAGMSPVSDSSERSLAVPCGTDDVRLGLNPTSTLQCGNACMDLGLDPTPAPESRTAGVYLELDLIPAAGPCITEERHLSRAVSGEAMDTLGLVSSVSSVSSAVTQSVVFDSMLQAVSSVEHVGREPEQSITVEARPVFEPTAAGGLVNERLEWENGLSCEQQAWKDWANEASCQPGATCYQSVMIDPSVASVILEPSGVVDPAVILESCVIVEPSDVNLSNEAGGPSSVTEPSDPTVSDLVTNHDAICSDSSDVILASKPDQTNSEHSSTFQQCHQLPMLDSDLLPESTVSPADEVGPPSVLPELCLSSVPVISWAEDADVTGTSLLSLMLEPCCAPKSGFDGEQ